MGPLPPQGPFWDPHSGIWYHREFHWQDHRLAGLHEPVYVAVDRAGVPHLFAQNEADLYLAQGYVMASMRLFQMDLDTRLTAGRLEELVGEKGASRDRFFVKMGLRQSMAETAARFLKNPTTATMMKRFVQGVNDRIATLKDLPPEYKLLGARPKLFDVSRVIGMDKALTFSLNGRSYDLYLTEVQQRLGTARALDLFPEFLPPSYEDYVFLSGQANMPKRVSENPELFHFQTHIRHFPATLQPVATNGSNNWAVGPSKSTTGHSILANDTHLNFSLPNIWFENQLSCPEFNVYGVSLPSIPGIVNGFNRWIAWGPTNGTTDAMDWYEIKFQDEHSWNYKWQGQWIAAQRKTSFIRDRDGGEKELEVVHTRYGVLMHREGRYGLVTKWLGLESGNELLALRRLYDAKNLDTCLSAFQTWQEPIQNFICADAEHIGLIHAGFIPKRQVGEGRFVMDAEKHSEALTKAIPSAARPMLKDPVSGFLRSANERVEGPTYPFYLGWDYEEPFRAREIRKDLEKKAKLSPADFISIQDDDLDERAALALPILLKALKTDSLSPQQRAAVVSLSRWHDHVRSDSPNPTIYDSWWRDLRHDLFDDDYPQPERQFYPKDMRIIWLLNRVAKNPDDSDSHWVDDQRTPEVETLPDIVTRAFRKSWRSLKQNLGPDWKTWKWSRFIKTQVPHVARIPGFGSPILPMNGDRDTVMANTGHHGPVYKLVVALGDGPQAWIQVPGGENGDPFSSQYESGVRAWSQGRMRSVEFYKDLADARQRAARVIELSPTGDAK